MPFTPGPSRKERRAIAAMPERLGQLGGGAEWNPARIPSQTGERRANKQMKTDEAAHRISRQPKYQMFLLFSTPRAEPERLSRLEAHLMEHLVHSQLLEDL